MNRLAWYMASATLLLRLGVADAQAAPGLSVDNFVDVADSVSQLLDTSGLAFSTMMTGAADQAANSRRARFSPTGTPGMPIRPQTFRRACPRGGEVKID